MTDQPLITALREGDSPRVRQLLDAGADLHAQDEHGWTALDWAAGRGEVSLVRLLLDRGADVFPISEDGRTPYQIAIAAGHADAARLLAAAEAARGGEAAARSSGQASTRPYCRAYPLDVVQRFAGWSESVPPDAGAPDTPILFLHRDFSLTRTSLAGTDVIVDGRSPDWQRFCVEELRFHPPDDFDWLAEPVAS